MYSLAPLPAPSLVSAYGCRWELWAPALNAPAPLHPAIWILCLDPYPKQTSFLKLLLVLAFYRSGGRVWLVQGQPWGLLVAEWKEARRGNSLKTQSYRMSQLPGLHFQEKDKVLSGGSRKWLHPFYWFDNENDSLIRLEDLINNYFLWFCLRDS